MQAVYGYILKLVLEFAFKKAQAYFSKEGDKILSKLEAVQKADLLVAAVKEAYDGEELTDDQKDKIVSAAGNLIKSYRV